MIKPVTATKVAANVADAVVGSSPKFRKYNGIKLPDIVSHWTIKTNDTEILIAIGSQYLSQSSKPNFCQIRIL